MQLRRMTLNVAVAGALAAALVAGTAPSSVAAAQNNPSGATLRQLAKHTGVRIGTAVDTPRSPPTRRTRRWWASSSPR